MNNTKSQDIVGRLKRLLPALTHGRGTHLDWGGYFKEHPNDPRMKDLGNVAHHEAQIKNYDDRIDVVQDAMGEIERLRETIDLIRRKVHAANRQFMTEGLRFEIRDLCDAALSDQRTKEGE